MVAVTPLPGVAMAAASTVPGPVKVSVPVSDASGAASTTVPPLIVALLAPPVPARLSVPPDVTRALDANPCTTEIVPPFSIVALAVMAALPLTVCVPSMSGAEAEAGQRPRTRHGR